MAIPFTCFLVRRLRAKELRLNSLGKRILPGAWKVALGAEGAYMANMRVFLFKA